MGIKSLAKEVGKEVAISTLTGLILADEKVVVPMDMVAIPAYQAYLLKEQPSFSIYIKEGEVITQVQPTDAMVSEEIVDSGQAAPPSKKRVRKKRKSPYKAAYSRHFASVKSKYKTKAGKWKKDGFKRAVREAHRLTKKGLK